MMIRAVASIAWCNEREATPVTELICASGPDHLRPGRWYIWDTLAVRGTTMFVGDDGVHHIVPWRLKVGRRIRTAHFIEMLFSQPRSTTYARG